MGAGCQEQPGVAQRCSASAVLGGANWLLGSPMRSCRGMLWIPSVLHAASSRLRAQALFSGLQKVFDAKAFINPMTPGILTTCASCAVPIPYTAPRCSKCHTRYCGQACQARHWNTGGHNRRCASASSAPAVLRNFTRTKNTTRPSRRPSKNARNTFQRGTRRRATSARKPSCNARAEGLVEEFCACGDRDGVDAGSMGVAHVSCLVRQAEVAMDDEMSRSWASTQDRWRRWDTCRLCGKRYHGDVQRAMGRGVLAREQQPHMRDIRRSTLDLLAGNLAGNDPPRGRARHSNGCLGHRATSQCSSSNSKSRYPISRAVGCMCRFSPTLASTLSVLGRRCSRGRSDSPSHDYSGKGVQLFVESSACRQFESPDRSQISRLERVDVAQTYAKDKFQSIPPTCRPH